MRTYAAVMTGKGTGAISTIQVFGASAKAVVSEIFKPASGLGVLEPDKILLGTISDGTETIDQVTIGCEGPETMAIHCHGNPLIVEMIMELLQRRGAKLVTAEQLLAEMIAAREPTSAIAVEAQLAQIKARTIEGTKIIANQISVGLGKQAAKWLANLDATGPDEIALEAERILKDSLTAKMIIFGCRAVITGPPNTGKSTLLNYLCGKEKAIVTAIRGTTRDWVSAQCHVGSYSVELVDTAGLDERLAETTVDAIDTASQRRAGEVLEGADVVLLVLDNSETAEQLQGALVEKLAGKRVVTILNKCDLPARFEVSKLPEILRDSVRISAKSGSGIEELLERILQVTGMAGFELKSDVCFTSRQERLLRQLQKAKSKDETAEIITELLNGRLSV